MIYHRMDIFRPEETGALVFSLDESGTIVSVFDKAINIRVSDRRLVSIVRHAAAMTPMSVLCPRLLDRGESFGIGQRVSFSDGILAADGWHLDMRGSSRFEGHPTVDKPFCMDAQKLDLFEKILHFSGQKDGLLGITLDGEPRNRFVGQGRKIVQKIQTHDTAQLARHLAEFTGLGPGFTPAGDDLISGFLMGEALAQTEHRLFLDAVPVARCLMPDTTSKAVLWKAAAGTCDAGRTLIWMALRRHFPRFLCRAAAELGRAETSKDMLAMVTHATRYGHTSGTDALTGLLLYFKTRLRHIHHDRRRIHSPTDVPSKQTSISG
ncbi:MAG: DUF2877 domain-containing protein [Desulfobacteraceae bacterium]